MTPPPAIAILGLGAIGSLYAARLLHAPSPIPLFAIADPARANALRHTPPTFNGAPLPLPILTPHTAPNTKPLLILIAVKSPALPAAIRLLPPFLGPNTQLLPLLNGVTTEDLLAAHFSPKHVLYGHVSCQTATRTGRAVEQHGPALLHLGAPEGPASPRLQQIHRLLTTCGIACHCPANILSAKWQKYILNVGANQTEALLRLSNGQLAANPDAMAFARALMNEAAALGHALHIPHLQSFPKQAERIIHSLPPNAYTSMAQDVLAGRPTEIDLFAGHICPAAARLGINTPANRLVLDHLAPPPPPPPQPAESISPPSAPSHEPAQESPSASRTPATPS